DCPSRIRGARERAARRRGDVGLVRAVRRQVHRDGLPGDTARDGRHRRRRGDQEPRTCGTCGEDTVSSAPREEIAQRRVMANVPPDLRYTKDHEWAKPEGTRYRVGITAYAQEQLGDVVF